MFARRLLRRQRGMDSLQAVILLGAGFLIVWGLMTAWESVAQTTSTQTASTVRGQFLRPGGAPAAGTGAQRPGAGSPDAGLGDGTGGGTDTPGTGEPGGSGGATGPNPPATPGDGSKREPVISINEIANIATTVIEAIGTEGGKVLKNLDAEALGAAAKALGTTVNVVDVVTTAAKGDDEKTLRSILRNFGSTVLGGEMAVYGFALGGPAGAIIFGLGGVVAGNQLGELTGDAVVAVKDALIGFIGKWW
jgi:hypothetical protein